MLQIRILNSQASELEKYLNRDYWEQRETQDLVSAQGEPGGDAGQQPGLQGLGWAAGCQGRERVREVNIIKDYVFSFLYF